MEYILLTGGTGFIGSHTAVELINSGYNIIILDNLSNSNESIIDKLNLITEQNILFYECDVTNYTDINLIFTLYKIIGVIHFAAFKAVGESVSNPLKYYQNNIVGLITLLGVMNEHKCKNIIFSSSATVYGDPDILPITESSKTYAINPYGQTKLMGEQILTDLYNSDPTYNIVLLRYFNPVGAHSSGLIGESPNGKPNNLFPYVLDVVKGVRPHLNIYGSDYDTHDGTGVRDYIHVVDLAKGHVKALDKIDGMGLKIYNLGTGKGYSVLDIVRVFGTQGSKIQYQLTERRSGDSAEVYANSDKARDELEWVAEKSLTDMVRDSLNFLNNQ